MNRKPDNHNRKGMTLTEIMLAMALLASAFIPIIGVMGSSIKSTDKDDRTIRAVNLCQDKINRALQFPFGILEPAPNANVTRGGDVALATFTSDTGAATSSIILTLGRENLNGFEVTSELIVEDVPGTFNVPTFDDAAKYTDERVASETGVAKNPANWGWVSQALQYAGLYYRYTVTVRWRDKGSNVEQFYTLVSNKARIRS